MIDMTADVLQILIATQALCVIIQGGDVRRLVAAFLFVAPVVVHEIFLADLDGLAYYGSAALFDLLTIVTLSLMMRPPKLALMLQQLAMISIMLNFYGWIAWMAYLAPDAYSLLFIGLYFTAIIILMWGGDGVLGGSKLGSGHSGISRHAYQRGYTYNHYKEAP